MYSYLTDDGLVEKKAKGTKNAKLNSKTTKTV